MFRLRRCVDLGMFDSGADGGAIGSLNVVIRIKSCANDTPPSGAGSHFFGWRRWRDRDRCLVVAFETMR